MTRLSLAITIAALLAVPVSALAQQSATQQEVRQMVRDGYAYSRDNLTDPPDTYAENGAWEFWSSGGLSQFVPADAPQGEYESFSLTPKHIRVIVLVEDQAAVAHFYAEGSFHQVGQPPITDYMTRVTQVFVKEDGEWKVRSSHFSPLLGGSGTNQRTLEN
jgi:hypothetical protein